MIYRHTLLKQCSTGFIFWYYTFSLHKMTTTLLKDCSQKMNDAIMNCLEKSADISARVGRGDGTRGGRIVEERGAKDRGQVMLSRPTHMRA